MTDRTQGILNRASEAEKFSGVRWILGDGVITNYMQSFVDETMKRNAEFQSRAGVSPKIVRKSPTKCCPWCDALVGEYKYPDDVPDDVYRRHDNCNCIVEFYPGDGKKQNVWSKEWQTADDEVLKERKTIGLEERKTVKEYSDGMLAWEQAAQANNVKYNEVAQLDKKLSTQEIIDRVGGGDKTKGSCASLGLAYIGNKSGLDVLDFRGGSSQSLFASYPRLKKLLELDGVKGRAISGYNDFKTAKDLLGDVEEGKEYYFAIARHAAIVRKVDGQLQYLELQSGYDIEGYRNGFYALDRDKLKKRFKCAASHTWYGSKYETPGIIIEAESLYNNDEFRELLGYLNTAADKQKKGVHGGIK